MGAMASQSPPWPLFTQPFVQAQIKENTNTPFHWPVTGEFPAQRASNAKIVFDDVIVGTSHNLHHGDKDPRRRMASLDHNELRKNIMTAQLIFRLRKHTSKLRNAN